MVFFCLFSVCNLAVPALCDLRLPPGSVNCYPATPPFCSLACVRAMSGEGRVHVCQSLAFSSWLTYLRSSSCAVVYVCGLMGHRGPRRCVSCERDHGDRMAVSLDRNTVTGVGVSWMSSRYMYMCICISFSYSSACCSF